MSRLLLIFIFIQYGVWMLLSEVKNDVFGVFDMFIHLLFIIQSFMMLFLIYMYIDGKQYSWNKDNESNWLDEKTKTLLNTITNACIFLSIFIITLNLFNVYVLDIITSKLF